MDKVKVFFSLFFIGLYIWSFINESISFSFISGIIIFALVSDTKLKKIIIPTVMLLICSFCWTIYKNDISLIWIILIVFLAIIVNIYESKNEKLKRFTTLLLVAFFCWAITSEEQNGKLIGILLFIIITGFIIFIWNKIDKEKKDEKNKLLEFMNDFFYSVKAYITYLQVNPLGIKEIRHSNTLPFNKDKLIAQSKIYMSLKLGNEIEQEDYKKVLLTVIPQLAFYRNDIPLSGYKLDSEFSDNINNEFSYALFMDCEEEYERLFNLLKKLGQLPP